MNWKQIKELRPSVGRFVPLPQVAQGRGRNGRKAAQRAGKPRKQWRSVS